MDDPHDRCGRRAARDLVDVAEAELQRARAVGVHAGERQAQDAVLQRVHGARAAPMGRAGLRRLGRLVRSAGGCHGLEVGHVRRVRRPCDRHEHLCPAGVGVADVPVISATADLVDTVGTPWKGGPTGLVGARTPADERPAVTYRRLALSLLAVLALVATACDTGEGVGAGPSSRRSPASPTSSTRTSPPPTPASRCSRTSTTRSSSPGGPQFEAALATDWEVSDDNLTWTFTLREGVTWHDGRDFTADDVVYSYERIMDEETERPTRSASRRRGGQRARRPDGRDRARRARPRTCWPTSAGSRAWRSSERDRRGRHDRHRAGRHRPVSGSSATARRADHPRGQPRLLGGRARTSTASSSASSPRAPSRSPTCATGEVDWTDNIPPQESTTPGGTTTRSTTEAAPATTTGTSRSTIEREPFDDVRVRRALAFGFDREASPRRPSSTRRHPTRPRSPRTASGTSTTRRSSTTRTRPGAARGGRRRRTSDRPHGHQRVRGDHPAAQVLAAVGEIGVTTRDPRARLRHLARRAGRGQLRRVHARLARQHRPRRLLLRPAPQRGQLQLPRATATPRSTELLDEARTETDEDARKDLYDEAARSSSTRPATCTCTTPTSCRPGPPGCQGYEVRPTRRSASRTSLSD
jgi:peptide/nickel transport system substrate-binding protein